MKKNNLHKFIANICMILFFSGIVFSGNVNAQPPGWSQIRSVTITENSGANLSNYQLRLIIDTQTPIGAGQMLANGDDIRFGTTCSGNTPLNYWIEGPMNSPSTVIWVKVPSIPANGMATIFMYFGNPLATSTSAIPGTFIGPHSSTDSVASGGAGGIGNSQRGFRFAPITDVLVESFGKRTPNNTTRYVTLFDFASQAILRQMQVAGPSAVYTYSSLASPIWLTPGTQYLLELFQGPLDNSYYFGTSSQIGQHLTYIDMKYCNSCTQNTFPTSTLANYHYGYPDFWYFTKQSVSPAPTFAVGSVVLPSLVASSNSPVNVGATINLSASNGFSSYSWSGPNAYSSNSQNPARPLASVPDAGVYTVIGVTANGCSATASTNVIVNSAIPAAALNFDGINDYVNLPSTPILGNQFTIECWINSASGADGLFHGIIGIPTNIGFNRPPSLYVFNGTRIHGGFGDGTNWNQFTTGSVITPNTWNHLAMTFNGTTLTLYVNGVSAFTTNAYAGRTPISVPITNIGRLDNYFQGSIDEVRFWNRASCQGAILNNMNCEIPGAAPGLIGNYHFNQGLDAAANPLVTTLIDASASGNNGTLTNMALNGPTSNWIAPGAVPSGVSCSAFVDNVPPVITCPPTVTANILPNSCAAPVSFTATATDLCSSPVALSYSPASGSSFNGGNTTVVATATDGRIRSQSARPVGTGAGPGGVSYRRRHTQRQGGSYTDQP